MRANLSRVTIEGIERGVRINPDARTVYLLAEALKVQPGDLWNISDISNLQRIHNRLIHSLEDIPDKELQEMASYIFSNIDEIKAYKKG